MMQHQEVGSAESAGTHPTSFVSRRRVYYLAGYDPRGSAFYYRLYRTQAAAQAAVNGCTYAIGRLTRDVDCSSFVVTSDGDGHRVETEYIFWHWHDVLRTNWQPNKWRVLLGMPATMLRLIRSGVLVKTAKLHRSCFGILLAPWIAAALSCVLGLAVSIALFGLAHSLGATAWFAAGFAALGLAGGVRAGVDYFDRHRVFWLQRGVDFVVGWSERPDQLRPHCDALARRVEADAVSSPADEVLLVGHSVGAMVAIGAAYSWRQRSLAGGAPQPTPVKLVTLGNVTPLLGMFAGAQWFRDQLECLAESDIPWLEYGAPQDALAYPLVDPLLACTGRRIDRHGYRMKSARFDQMLSAPEFAALKKDFFALHFQYLMATSRIVRNDYFSLTAGPLPLPVDGSQEANPT